MLKLPKNKNYAHFLQYGLMVFVLLIPFVDHSRWLLDKILPARILLLFLFGFGGLLVLRQLVAKKIKPGSIVADLRRDPIFVTLVLLWVVRVVSMLGSLNSRASLELLAFYTAMIGLYVLMKTVLLNSRFFVISLTRTYVYVGAAIGFYGLFQYLLFKMTGRLLPGVLVGGDYIRLPGTFFDANHFAAFLATVAPMTVAFAWLTKNNWLKVFWWFCYLVLAFVVLYSFSRSGQLAFAVGSLCLLVFGLTQGYMRKVVPLLGGLLLAGLLIFVSNATGRSLLDRVKSAFNLQEPSTRAHYLIISGEIQLFREKPLLGVGYGSFTEHFRDTEFGREHAQVDKATERLPAHSVWLEILSETGVVGFTLYTIFAYAIVSSLTRLIRFSRNKSIKIYAIGFLSGSLGVWTGGIFYSYNLEFFWFYIFLGYFFSLVVTNLAKEGAILPSGDKKESLPWWEILPATVILGLASLIIFRGLGQAALTTQEASLALIAKNLFGAAQWVNLQDQYTSYFERSPLYFWATRSIISLYGATTLSARFLPSVFTIGAVVLTALVGRRLIGRLAGFISGLLLLLLTPFVFLGRSVNTESLAIFFLLLTVYLLTFYKKGWLPILAAGVSLGMMGLSDGFLLLIILPVIFFWAWNFRRDVASKQRHFTIAAAIGVAIFLPWHLANLFGNPVLFIPQFFLRIPNYAVILPFVALGLTAFAVRIFRSIAHENSQKVPLFYSIVLGSMLMVAVLGYYNSSYIQTRITAPQANKDLINLLLSPEYQDKHKFTLYINGVSPEITAYYIGSKFKIVETEEIENTLTQKGEALMITSKYRADKLLPKFENQQYSLRQLTQSGDLVLLSNF